MSPAWSVCGRHWVSHDRRHFDFLGLGVYDLLTTADGGFTLQGRLGPVRRAGDGGGHGRRAGSGGGRRADGQVLLTAVTAVAATDARSHTLRVEVDETGDGENRLTI